MEFVLFLFLSLMSLLHTARLHITYCLVPIIYYFASGEGGGGLASAGQGEDVIYCQSVLFIDPVSMLFHALGWNVTTCYCSQCQFYLNWYMHPHSNK